MCSWSSLSLPAIWKSRFPILTEADFPELHSKLSLEPSNHALGLSSPAGDRTTKEHPLNIVLTPVYSQSTFSCTLYQGIMRNGQMPVEDPDTQLPALPQPTHLLASSKDEKVPRRLRNVPESTKLPDPEDILFLLALRDYNSKPHDLQRRWHSS